MRLCHALLLIAPRGLIKNVCTPCLSNLSKWCLTHFSNLVSCHSLPGPVFLPPQHTMAFMLSLFPISEIQFHPLPSVKILPIFPDTAQLSLCELPPYLSSFYMSTPEHSLLPLDSHSTLSSITARYILLCPSSLLDSGFFICIVTTGSTVSGMNSWSQGKKEGPQGTCATLSCPIQFPMGCQAAQYPN